MRYSNTIYENETVIIKSRFTPYGGFTIDSVLVESHSDSDLQLMLNGKHPFVKAGICDLGLCLLDSVTGEPVATLKKVSPLSIAVDNTTK